MSDINLQLLGFDVTDKDVLHMLQNDVLVVNALNKGIPLAKIILILSQRHSEDFNKIVELSSRSVKITEKNGFTFTYLNKRGAE